MTTHFQGKDPKVFTRCLDASGSAIDRAHAFFDELEDELSGSLVPLSLLHRTRLAVHEWLANLVQHADFQERAPEINLTVRVTQHQAHCTVEDNSAGLDLSFQGLDPNFRTTEQVPDQESFPERGMGLAFIRACAHELQYEHLDSDRHRLMLSIRASADL